MHKKQQKEINVLDPSLLKLQGSIAEMEDSKPKVICKEKWC